MLGSDPLATLVSAQKQQMDLVPLGDGHHIVTHPRIIEQILVSNARAFVKGQASRRLEQVFGASSLLLEGDAWKARRRILQPALSREHINAFRPTVISKTKMHVQSWKGDFDLWDASLALFMDLTLTNLLGSDVPDVSKLVQAWNELYTIVTSLRFGESVSETEPLDYIQSRLWNLVEEKRDKPDDGSMLSRLVRTTLDNEQIKSELITIFVGGYETSAAALSFSIALLSRLSDDERNAFTLRHCLAESLRLYPPSWLLVRAALPKHGLDGVDVDDQLLISPFAIHRDARYWASPETFDPSRFLSKPESCTWIPFGEGPRKCLGANYALLELEWVVETIFGETRLEVMTPIEACAHVGLRPPQPFVCRKT